MIVLKLKDTTNISVKIGFELFYFVYIPIYYANT